MGLDAVEFVFALEDTFGIAISDAEATAMETPRLVVDFLVRRLPSSSTATCHTQQAFYRLRTAVVRAYQTPRNAIHPTTEWRTLLPDRYLNRAWGQLQRVAGIADWPPYRILWWQPPVSQTVGGTATYLARKTPHLFKRPDQGWHRPEIERIIRDLIAEEFGILHFDWDAHFVRDLHID